MKFTFIKILLALVFLFNCTNSKSQDPIPVHETFNLDSKIVGETRVINIWTPPNYKNSTETFPVLYMADGGIQEDFPHIANTLSELIAAKKIPPIILVGIENTQRRRDLTGPTTVKSDKKIAPVVGGSENFRNFIKDELIPEINKKYRTNEQKGIIGESLAGLFVTETFLLHPDLFDFYIAFDPSMWWNDKYLLKSANEHLAKFPNSEKKFWFAGSSAEDIFATVDKFAKVIEAQNLKNLQWKYSPEPNEKHNTIFRATKEKALIWTLNKQ